MQCKFYDKQITLPTIDGEFSLLAVKISLLFRIGILDGLCGSEEKQL